LLELKAPGLLYELLLEFTNSLPAAQSGSVPLREKSPAWFRSAGQLKSCNWRSAKMSESTFPCRRHFAGIFSTSLVLAILALGLGLGAALGQDAQSSQDQSQPSQESAPPMGGHMHGRSGMMKDPNSQLKHLSKRLNLSDDQQTKIKPILEDQQKQMQQLWSDNSLSRQDRFSKMRDIRENSDAQIKNMLNEDQQKNFDKMREEQRSRMRERRGENQPNRGPNDQPQ
jgi:periplasmic protein CpxP/Spy